MKLRFALFLLIFAAGCQSAAPPITAAPPTRQGIFMVSGQDKREPTVVVSNDTDATLHLLMNNSEGKALELVVQPRSVGTLDVPKGHYEAKVYDDAGKVRSSYGSADIAEYKEYRAEFIVEMGGTYHFHIGD